MFTEFLCKKCKEKWRGTPNEICRVCKKCDAVGTVVKTLKDD